MHIAYLCNRKKRCGGTLGCGGDYCHHTTDPKFALNGACKNPENHEERFSCILDNSGEKFYIEKMQQEEK